MARDLTRLLRPHSIALFGGRWSASAVEQLVRLGFDGAIWPVNPARETVCGIPCLASIDDLPGAPDAAFVAVNRNGAIDLVARLAAMGAGGAVCFAAGFGESSDGAALQVRLVDAAGDMPLLGPNCYGFVNYLDRVALWPDQHGGIPVERGVAILAQSSNIAINLTMQRRALPLACMLTVGNQAQLEVGEIAASLVEDPRISAIGLHIEGFGDLRTFELFAEAARSAGKPVVALKLGRSTEAKAAGLTHTASLTGASAVSSAFLCRLGIAEVESPGTFLECLQLLHAFGRLPGRNICSISCSGGEAGLMADLAVDKSLRFRPFTRSCSVALSGMLGPLVTVANPFDYHTFVWGDVPAMTDIFAAVMADGFDLAVFVLDLPRDDRCDPAGHACAVDAIIAARRRTGARVAVVASLPENMPEPVAMRFQSEGIAPMHGLEDTLAAIAAAAAGAGAPAAAPALRAAPLGRQERSTVLDEAQSKAALAASGLPVPRNAIAGSGCGPAQAAATAGLQYPLALKALGVAHKTEANAVALGLASEADLSSAAAQMPASRYLVEEMVDDCIAELLVGVARDETGLFALTFGAGGVLAEMQSDSVTLLLPVTEEAIAAALSRLRIAPLLDGWRGRPPADRAALIAAVMAVARYAEANCDALLELDVNPLIAGAHAAVAADALIRLRKERRPK